MIVPTEAESSRGFKPSEHGLHYLDVSKEDSHLEYMLVHTSERESQTRGHDEVEEVAMVNTVHRNF